jgi:hypothetical protein
VQHEDQEGPLLVFMRPNGRPKFYQVRKGQLEATATPYASRASTHPRRPHREGAVLHRHQTPPQRRHLPSIDASLIGARRADCNCVFDTTIDLDGASAATATNLRKGAAEYLNILTEYSLSTISPMLYPRDFLGNNTKLFTNAHTSREEE